MGKDKHLARQRARGAVKNTGGRPPRPADETKSDRFRRMATTRISKILPEIAKLGYLENRHYYEYTPEQVDKIEQAIMEQVKATMGVLRGTKAIAGFEL